MPKYIEMLAQRSCALFGGPQSAGHRIIIPWFLWYACCVQSAALPSLSDLLNGANGMSFRCSGTAQGPQPSGLSCSSGTLYGSGIPTTSQSSASLSVERRHPTRPDLPTDRRWDQLASGGLSAQKPHSRPIIPLQLALYDIQCLQWRARARAKPGVRFKTATVPRAAAACSLCIPRAQCKTHCRKSMYPLLVASPPLSLNQLLLAICRRDLVHSSISQTTVFKSVY